MTTSDRKKYKVGDKVSFTFNGKTKVGVVEIVDTRGTFERPNVRSYDIFVKKDNTLYKHIGEDFVEE